jgi:hypothetical protein
MCRELGIARCAPPDPGFAFTHVMDRAGGDYLPLEPFYFEFEQELNWIRSPAN